MAEFKLSVRAEADLLDIYEYTANAFGTYQADSYLGGLERTFDLLANFPRIGATVNDIAPGYRRFRFQAHVVFYDEDHDGVVIRVILHTRAKSGPICSNDHPHNHGAGLSIAISASTSMRLRIAAAWLSYVA